MAFTTGEQQFITDLIAAWNAYAVAMEMAAWSQATATTNANTLATALTAAQTKLTAYNNNQGTP